MSRRCHRIGAPHPAITAASGFRRCRYLRRARVHDGRGRERSTGRSYRSPPRPGPPLSAVPPSTNRRPPSITTARAPPARPISIHNSPSRHTVGGATVSAARQTQRQRPLRPVGKRRRVFGADKVSECRLAAAIFSLSPCWRSAPRSTHRPPLRLSCDPAATRRATSARRRPTRLRLVAGTLPTTGRRSDYLRRQFDDGRRRTDRATDRCLGRGDRALAHLCI